MAWCEVVEQFCANVLQGGEHWVVCNCFAIVAFRCRGWSSEIRPKMECRDACSGSLMCACTECGCKWSDPVPVAKVVIGVMVMHAHPLASGC